MESSVTGRAKKCLENFTYVGRKRFTFCTCGRPQNQKNYSLPSQKSSPTICKIDQNFMTPLTLFVDK